LGNLHLVLASVFLRIRNHIFKILSGEVQSPDILLDGQCTIMGLFVYL
jgi:hypothetical protein